MSSPSSPTSHTPVPPLFPSLISLTVSVDVKHHVYLLACNGWVGGWWGGEREREREREREHLGLTKGFLEKMEGAGRGSIILTLHRGRRRAREIMN